MDRRQKKTRSAIFSAFIELLDKKDYGKISVQEIIDEADVGRATFYMHFETKDFLLKALCEELFEHILDCSNGKSGNHSHYSSCKRQCGAFSHLFEHLKENDDNLLKLLSSRNNELFVSYFKENLNKMVEEQVEFANKIDKLMPKEFIVNHISATFVDTVMWWIKGGKKESTDTMVGYFYALLDGIIK
ncbi:MAG: TetR/AcrR family transcriptional regulator [Clostridia bacterium]|nr:TetR/AcrR family transcriptional regulator [Clostridia bacterium]